MWQKNVGPSTSLGAQNLPGGPQNGGKMTRMDILEFRDINRPDPYNKIWFK